MPLLNFSTPTQTELEKAALLKCRNNAPTLTPKETFDIHVKRITLGNPKRIGKFHFKAVKTDSEIFLFNGLGEQLGVYINNLHGQRDCRAYAFELYNSSRKTELVIKGYLFDFISE